MPNPALIPTFLRELLVSRSLPREPEPDLVMDDPQQVAAYAEAGRIDGIMASSYLFHSARISQVVQGCKTVLDLGCGPATQLAQVAQFNPKSPSLASTSRRQCSPTRSAMCRSWP
jgi:arsenite methyltransferase